MERNGGQTGLDWKSPGDHSTLAEFNTTALHLIGDPIVDYIGKDAPMAAPISTTIIKL